MPLPPFNPPLRRASPSRLCSGMGPYRQTSSPTLDGLPFRGLLLPLQGPPDRTFACANLATDDWAASAVPPSSRSSVFQCLDRRASSPPKRRLCASSRCPSAHPFPRVAGVDLRPPCRQGSFRAVSPRRVRQSPHVAPKCSGWASDQIDPTTPRGRRVWVWTMIRSESLSMFSLEPRSRVRLRVRPGWAPSCRRERVHRESVRAGSCAVDLSSVPQSRAPPPSSSQRAVARA